MVKVVVKVYLVMVLVKILVSPIVKGTPKTDVTPVRQKTINATEQREVAEALFS